MDKIEQEKLLKSLKEEEKTILAELNELARKNPKAEGDFNVPFIDEGNSLDENAREITEFERTKVIVDNLEKRSKDIRASIEKLEKGTYGQCEKCSIKIDTERLKVVPAARFCISCAKIYSHEV